MSTYLKIVLFFLCVSCSYFQADASERPEWTTPLTPFQIADNLYYVGSRDLAAYLITTPAGNILINANIESSPPLIRASVEKLGFAWKDTKILLNSQAHSDHMGGAAQILRETNAKNMVMTGDAEVVRSGGRKDFAFGSDGIGTFPRARVDRVLRDGDTVVLGGVTLTAHRTGGHTAAARLGHSVRTLLAILQESFATLSSSAAGDRCRSIELMTAQRNQHPIQEYKRFLQNLCHAARTSLRHFPRRAWTLLRSPLESKSHAKRRPSGIHRSQGISRSGQRSQGRFR